MADNQVPSARYLCRSEVKQSFFGCRCFVASNCLLTRQELRTCNLGQRKDDDHRQQQQQ